VGSAPGKRNNGQSADKLATGDDKEVEEVTEMFADLAKKVRKLPPCLQRQ
jgi:hypothetical protein